VAASGSSFGFGSSFASAGMVGHAGGRGRGCWTIARGAGSRKLDTERARRKSRILDAGSAGRRSRILDGCGVRGGLVEAWVGVWFRPCVGVGLGLVADAVSGAVSRCLARVRS